MNISFMLVAVFGIASFSFEAFQTIVAQQQGVDVLPDVTSNISLICIPDLPTIIGVPCEPPKKPEPKIELPIETKLTNITTGNWINYTNDKCGLTIEHPENFIILEKHSRFQKGSDFSLKATDPFMQLSVFCIEVEKPLNLFQVPINHLKSSALENPNIKLIEDINYTKWSVDNAKVASFINAFYNEDDIPTSANERFFVRGNTTEVMMYFATKAMEFDIPEMQEIEKRMINSIKFYD